jgi:hypothetical protein
MIPFHRNRLNEPFYVYRDSEGFKMDKGELSKSFAEVLNDEAIEAKGLTGKEIEFEWFDKVKGPLPISE